MFRRTKNDREENTLDSVRCRFVARTLARGCLPVRHEILITKNVFRTAATTLVREARITAAQLEASHAP